MKAIRQRTQGETEKLRERFKVEQERLSPNVVRNGQEDASNSNFVPALSEGFLEDFLREVLK